MGGWIYGGGGVQAPPTPTPSGAALLTAALPPLPVDLQWTAVPRALPWPHSTVPDPGFGAHLIIHQPAEQGTGTHAPDPGLDSDRSGHPSPQHIPGTEAPPDPLDLRGGRPLPVTRLLVRPGVPGLFSALHPSPGRLDLCGRGRLPEGDTEVRMRFAGGNPPPNALDLSAGGILAGLRRRQWSVSGRPRLPVTRGGGRAEWRPGLLSLSLPSPPPTSENFSSGKVKFVKGGPKMEFRYTNGVFWASDPPSLPPPSPVKWRGNNAQAQRCGLKDRVTRIRTRTHAHSTEHWTHTHTHKHVRARTHTKAETWNSVRPLPSDACKQEIGPCG